MKQSILLLFFFVGIYCLFAQENRNMVNLLIETYETYYSLNIQKQQEQIQIPEQIQEEEEEEEDEEEEEEYEEQHVEFVIPVIKSTCPPIPADFYQFFKTTFIDFNSLREGEKVSTFSFSDNLSSPLKRNLVMTSGYGMRNGKKHFGIDFRVNVGDTVCSIFCGKVRVAKWDKAYGYVIVVRNYNMSEAVYAHLDKILVSVDQEVEVGHPIGLGGNTGVSTGPHLHFELRYKGFPINPIVDGKFLK